MTINHTKDIKVLFATFAPWEKGKRMPTNGMIEPMVYFLTPKVKDLVVIDNPHPGSDRVMPIIEEYKEENIKQISYPKILNILKPLLEAKNYVGTQTIFKIRDSLAVISVGVKLNTKFDVFIGLESIHTLAGVVLKKLGIVKKVVYYVSDYSPVRYKNKVFNNVYLWLDRKGCIYSDYIWDVSTAMMPARIKAGLPKKYETKNIHVPNALFPKQIYVKKKTTPFSLVFAGTLGEENGPDLAIEALSIAKKTLPKLTLHVFGGGKSDLKRLNKLTSKLKLKNDVIFHGFVTDQVKLSHEIANFELGLAPYKGISNSPRWYADATKIRLYLASGLPVITTQVPPLGQELIKSKSGVVTKDNPKNIAAAIVTIFKNKKTYNTYRSNAIKKAKNNTWENTYSNAFHEIGVDL